VAANQRKTIDLEAGTIGSKEGQESEQTAEDGKELL